MIKGVTDIFKRPVVGKVSIGYTQEKPKKKTRQVFRTDYFLIWRKPLPSEQEIALKESHEGKWLLDRELMSRLKKPVELEIAFLGHQQTTIDEVWKTELAYFTNRKICSCSDGEMATREEELGNSKVLKCKGRECTDFIEGRCKYTGYLLFTLGAKPTFPGVFFFETHGYHSIANISSCLELLMAIRGSITNISLMLSILPQTARPNGMNIKIYTVNLSFKKQESSLIHDIAYSLTHEKLDVPKKEIKYDLTEEDLASNSAEFYPEAFNYIEDGTEEEAIDKIIEESMEDKNEDG